MNNKECCSITSSVRIPFSEISFTFSRSSGSGGQHVNKVNSRVTLWFDISASPSLTEQQKERIRHRLSGRINKQGVLQLDADRRRSQGANREDALNRFASMLRAALHVDKARRKTKPSHGAKKRRLHSKKRRGTLKKQRSGKYFSDE